MKIQMKDITEDGLLVMYKPSGELIQAIPVRYESTFRADGTLTREIMFCLEGYNKPIPWLTIIATNGKLPSNFEFIGYI